MALKKKKSKSGFQYKERTAEHYQKQASKDSNFDKFLKSDFKTFSTKEDGKYHIRILPPTWNDDEDYGILPGIVQSGHYGLPIHIVYGVGADKQAYLSLKTMRGKKDPLEEERNRAKNSGRDEDAKALWPRKRTLVWIIDRKHPDEGPMLWPMPKSVDDNICAVAQNDEEGGVLNIDSPESGYDIFFNKTGKGLNTDYTGVKASRKESPLSDDDDQAEEWMTFVQENPLPTVLKFYPYDHIKAVLDGGMAEDAEKDEDEDEDEKPKSKSKLKSKSKAADEDEDEDEEDEPKPKSKKSKPAPVEEDEDEDEEPAPKLKPKKKAVVEEDEDEDDEDEDEEPAPAPKKKPKAKIVEEDDEDEDENEEDEPKPKSKKKPAPAKGKKKVVDEFPDDEDEDEDED